MGDVRGLADDDWAADMLYGSEPSAAPATENSAVAVNAGVTKPPEPVDLDVQERPSPDSEWGQRADVNAGAKKTALVMAAGLAVAVVGIAAALVTFSDNPAPPPPPRAGPVAAAAAAQGPTTSAVAPDQDQAIPFAASAGCPAGSTSAQSLTASSDSVCVCVRGAQGAAVDGQVLHIDLGRSFLLAAVSVTPGWVAKTPGGKDEWLQHRVVTRLQYIFNDDDRTIFTQDTGNTHGPVTTPLPKKVLASRVTVIVLQTSRAPASPPPSVDPTTASQPGFIDSMLGVGGSPLAADATQTAQPDPVGTTMTDPADATFAMSALAFFGHQPN
jgi:hypothetical protein